MSSLARAIREAQAVIDARRATESRSLPTMEKFYGSEAVAEYRRWRAGGPVPTSPKGLEIMADFLILDEMI